MVSEASVMAAAAKYSETDFKLGDTTFYVRKLTAMRGHKVSEMIRAAVGVQTLRFGGASDVPTLIAGIILSLNPVDVEAITKVMWERVEFKNGTAQTPLPLLGNEDMAFEHLEPVDVYEVIVRCLAVNFTASLEGILSRMPEGLLSSPPLPTAT